MPERASPFSCVTPFDSGGALCRACRKDELVDGARACRRLVAESAAMRALVARVPAIARSQAPVVILGETGTGKEVLARLVHANSTRRLKALVAVNVAALPAELLESELFGHLRGAFTGAHEARTGLFQAADGGTLFLDEIAEMPLPLQAKLLRALQDGEVRRVGEARATAVDVRLLCATHADLRRAVAERRFREDLYYRIKVFSLELPPLRERRDDVLPLANHFLGQEGHPGAIGKEAQAVLLGHRWPGNVRELQNAMRHGAALAPGRALGPEHLPGDLVSPPVAYSNSPLRPLAEVEREHVVRVLEACGGHQADAARILGIGRTTLWRKLQAYGLAVGENV
jgi:DNA-binding NtrC family response regulator